MEGMQQVYPWLHTHLSGSTCSLNHPVVTRHQQDSFPHLAHPDGCPLLSLNQRLQSSTLQSFGAVSSAGKAALLASGSALYIAQEQLNTFARIICGHGAFLMARMPLARSLFIGIAHCASNALVIPPDASRPFAAAHETKNTDAALLIQRNRKPASERRCLSPTVQTSRQCRQVAAPNLPAQQPVVR
jgi:hypothetical protein